VEKQEQEVLNNRDTCSSTSTTLVGHTSTAEGSKSRTTSTTDADTAKREMPPPMSGVSYAVAIYPYMAEQEDEFDVVV
jgi:bZIP factor